MPISSLSFVTASFIHSLQRQSFPYNSPPNFHSNPGRVSMSGLCRNSMAVCWSSCPTHQVGEMCNELNTWKGPFQENLTHSQWRPYWLQPASPKSWLRSHPTVGLCLVSWLHRASWQVFSSRPARWGGTGAKGKDSTASVKEVFDVTQNVISCYAEVRY